MKMMKTCLALIVPLLGACLLSGCEGFATLAKQQKIDRAEMSLTRIDTTPATTTPSTPSTPSTPAATVAPAAPAAPATAPTIAPAPTTPGTFTFTMTPAPAAPATPPTITPAPATPGTYTFTLPPTVTSVKQTTNGMQQYRLYVGRPAPQATPFIVLTVAPNLEAPMETASGSVTHRTYHLNGLLTEEWKGYDLQRHPFCELLVSHDDGGDQLHAIAVARTTDERAVALKILATIQWTPLAENK